MEVEPSEEFRFTFDLAVYRLSAIKKAAYRFAGDFQVTIEQLSDLAVNVGLRRINRTSSPRLDPQLLPREVLDQELREEVAGETKGIRDLLLAHTFSGMALTDPQGESGDYAADPLDIVHAPRSAPQVG